MRGADRCLRKGEGQEGGLYFNGVEDASTAYGALGMSDGRELGMSGVAVGLGCQVMDMSGLLVRCQVMEMVEFPEPTSDDEVWQQRVRGPGET